MTLTEQSTGYFADGSAPADRLWTREEYDRLVDLGFFNGERLELIEGRIYQMSPQRVPHSVAVELVDRYLRQAFSQGHRIRVQLPFRSGEGSEPEPDLAVIAGDDPRASTEHPSAAVLIVEISDTTLEHDRRKAAIYAGSGVREYWIVNLVSRSLEVYRNASRSENGTALYGDTKVLSERERLSAVGGNVAVTVAELLP
jgi:Uma2 family endonuclease